MDKTLPKHEAAAERGREVTRCEAFVDAAFAFAVTLLVVSFDAVPRNVAELLQAMKGIPAFAVAFALLALIWYQHNRWSRRYGLDDTPTVLLSLLLVFQVLVYVYPLKMLATSFMGWVSRGTLGFGFEITHITDIRTVFVVYGIAWTTLGVNLALFFVHAWRRRRELNLTLVERVDTSAEIAVALVMPATGILSVAVALLLPWDNSRPGWLFALPGVVYSLMSFSHLVGAWQAGRVRPRIEAEMAASATPAGDARAPGFKRRRRRPRGPRSSA
jgi:uncharacterized membrane protein